MSVSRRKFIIGGSLLGSLPFLKLDSIKSFEDLFSSTDLYISLAGHLKSRTKMAIGLFRGPKSMARDITDIRIKRNYRSQMKYNSSDRYKIDFCKEVIDLFMTEDSARLFVKVVDNPFELLSGRSPLQRINFRIDSYAELLEAAGLKGKNHTVLTKNESPFGPSRSFKDKVESTEGLKFKLRAVKSYQDDMLQLSSFLTGTIVSDLKGEVRNVKKIEMNDYLKDSLGITAFEGESNIGNKIILI